MMNHVPFGATDLSWSRTLVWTREGSGWSFMRSREENDTSPTAEMKEYQERRRERPEIKSSSMPADGDQSTLGENMRGAPGWILNKKRKRGKWCSGHVSATTWIRQSTRTAPDDSAWEEKSRVKMPRSEMTSEALLWPNRQRLRQPPSPIGYNNFLNQFSRVQTVEQAEHAGSSASIPKYLLNRFYWQD